MIRGKTLKEKYKRNINTNLHYFFYSILSIFIIPFLFLKNFYKELISQPFIFLKKLFKICLLVIFFIYFCCIFQAIYAISFAYKKKPIAFKVDFLNFVITSVTSDLIENSPLKTSFLGNKVRDLLYNDYKNISSQFCKNEYSSIAFFYFLNGNKKLSKDKIYYKKYIKELETILDNYQEVNNIDEYRFIESYPRGHKYPHRTILYLYLLNNYANYVQDNKSKDNIKKLKIYKSNFFIIQEQDINNDKNFYYNSLQTNNSIKNKYNEIYPKTMQNIDKVINE